MANRKIGDEPAVPSNTMQTLKTFFKKEIFAEVVMPTKPSSKVVIICDGMPSVPSKRMLLEFFAKKGYCAIHVRYRGSWESHGKFLEVSPDRDILDVIDELPKGFTDLWTKKNYKLHPKETILLGTSFGGPAAILASRDARVTKVIVIAPVVDWKRDGKKERMKDFIPFMLEAYGMAYRTTKKNWSKLLNGGFYSPMALVQTLDGSKLFILHAKDDDIVPFRPVAQFAKKTGATFVALKTGGHLSSSMIMEPKIWKTISRFLRS